MVIDELNAETIAPILRENIAKEAHLMTDEASYYTLIGREFAKHDVVRHGDGESDTTPESGSRAASGTWSPIPSA